MNRIAELRKAAKISQSALGKIVGAAQNTVCNWENGNREPDFETIQKLADYFHVSVDYLLGRDDTKNDPATEYSDEVKKIYDILSQLTHENQEKLLELAILYVENQKKSKGKK